MVRTVGFLGEEAEERVREAYPQSPGIGSLRSSVAMTPPTSSASTRTSRRWSSSMTWPLAESNLIHWAVRLGHRHVRYGRR